MRILIISAEVWRDDTNGGNVLSNLFSGIDAEFAQIYCNPGTPKNNICKLYYQMTDSMAIKNIINKTEMGNVIRYKDYPCYEIDNNSIDKNDLKKNPILKKIRGNTIYAIKEFIWSMSTWKNKKLEKFVLDFKPDVIFAPCYGSHIMLSITRHIAKILKVPVISYISDDHYSLKQFSISPIYWFNRFILRKNLRKTFPYYDLVYTMTEEQLDECKKAFNCNIKILKKFGNFQEKLTKSYEKDDVIRLVYAGGIHYGRWKTLIEISKAIRSLNKEGKKYILEIYTGNDLTKYQKKYLNDGKNSIVHGLVEQDELKEIYKQADIALHVESFNLKDKLATRISFSTKIIDLLSSSCAVMAICWEKHSGYTYLNKYDAAICINSTNKIEAKLREIYNNKSIIDEYSEKAWKCGKMNHSVDDIQKFLVEDFRRVGGLDEAINNITSI